MFAIVITIFKLPQAVGVIVYCYRYCYADLDPSRSITQSPRRCAPAEAWVAP